ncbi:MAG: arginase [Planctomycetes bacterium]|nr:arginase [Planctomycetota bacterium]
MKRVSIIGIPIDLGTNRRGTDMGPSVIRYAGLGPEIAKLGYEVRDEGNLSVFTPETRPEETRHKDYHDEIVKICSDLSDLTYAKLREGYIPLVLGGDHSVAMGSIDGVLRHCENAGVIWFDAHADINTFETSPSGNVHGMPVAGLLGLGGDTLFGPGRKGIKLDKSKIVMIGLRALDPGEVKIIHELGIVCYTMHEIDRFGMHTVMARTFEHLKDCQHLHISFDMDGIDPRDAPGVGTPVRGGISYREAHLALELAASTGKVGSLDFVEVNPVFDVANQTAETAVKLILSALGKRIL